MKGRKSKAENRLSDSSFDISAIFDNVCSYLMKIHCYSFLIYTLQLTFGYTIFKIFEIYLKILLGVLDKVPFLYINLRSFVFSL